MMALKQMSGPGSLSQGLGRLVGRCRPGRSVRPGGRSEAWAEEHIIQTVPLLSFRRFFSYCQRMASVIILNSKKRNHRFEPSESEAEGRALTSLPREPWEADLTLRVLSGGR